MKNAEFPEGLRAVVGTDLSVAGPWSVVVRQNGMPRDRGGILGSDQVHDVALLKRSGHLRHEPITPSEVIANGAACVTCGAAFFSVQAAAAHHKARHSSVATAMQAAEAARQSARDAADAKGAAESARLYSLEHATCWCCGQATRGGFVEPKPEGYISKRPKMVHREVSALTPLDAA